MPAEFTFADALTQAARAIHSTEDLDSTVQAIVTTAARSVPGMSHAGITLLLRNRPETLASTHPLVDRLDAVQYAANEGPCLEALRNGPVVRVERLYDETRWPVFVAAATAEGVRSQLGLRLYDDDVFLGGLNLYSTTNDVIADEAQHIGELFASHASIALRRTQREEQLNEALATRRLIGQALGMVMQRFQIDEHRAFEYLIRVSNHSNLKLRDIAQQLVDEHNAGTRRVD